MLAFTLPKVKNNGSTTSSRRRTPSVAASTTSGSQPSAANRENAEAAAAAAQPTAASLAADRAAAEARLFSDLPLAASSPTAAASSQQQQQQLLRGGAAPGGALSSSSSSTPRPVPPPGRRPLQAGRPTAASAASEADSDNSTSTVPKRGISDGGGTAAAHREKLKAAELEESSAEALHTRRGVEGSETLRRLAVATAEEREFDFLCHRAWPALLLVPHSADRLRLMAREDTAREELVRAHDVAFDLILDVRQRQYALLVDRVAARLDAADADFTFALRSKRLPAYQQQRLAATLLPVGTATTEATASFFNLPRAELRREALAELYALELSENDARCATEMDARDSWIEVCTAMAHGLERLAGTS